MRKKQQDAFKYIIPCAPVPKKNSQRIVTNQNTGKPLIIQSERYEAFEAYAGYFLRPKPGIDYPVNVKCIFYMPTRRRVDTVNLEEAVHDVLVTYGVLKDDSRDIIASKDGTRTFYDKENPRVEIEITPYQGEYEQWQKVQKE